MSGPDYRRVYQRCIADIQGIRDLFDDRSLCQHRELAREKMANLKAGWRAVIRNYRGTEAERIVSEALARITVKSNSNPSRSWLSNLEEARIDLDFYARQ